MQTIFKGPDAWAEAFSTCREADRPMKAIIHGLSWKIFPSGRAEPGIRGIRRRRELDRELRAMGAHVIRVRDLGACFEARQAGAMAIQSATDPMLDSTRPDDYPEGQWSADLAGEWASDAAGWARKALGLC